MITSAEEFCRLRYSDDMDEQDRATHDEIPKAVMLDIIEKYPDMRRWIAHNKKVPLNILQILSLDEDSSVRHSVAVKNKIDEALCVQLSTDEDESVRSSIARHKKTPLYVLKRLAEDYNHTVSEIALERLEEIIEKETNKKASKIESAEAFCCLKSSNAISDFYHIIYSETSEAVWLEVIEKYPEIRFWVVRNKTIPLGVLKKLAADADWRVRNNVALHHNIDADLAIQLSKDSNEFVRMNVISSKLLPNEVIRALKTDPSWFVSEAARAIPIELDVLDS